MTNEMLYVLAALAAVMWGCGLYLKHQLKVMEGREENVWTGEAVQPGPNKVHVFREIVLKRKHPATGTNVIYVPIRKGMRNKVPACSGAREK